MDGLTEGPVSSFQEVNVRRLVDVAIVGGGASGALTAVSLLRRGGNALRIALVDERGRFGRGVAYSTRCAAHLLNVPVEKMSALPDDPEHFLRWMKAVEPATRPGDFVPRARFGQYLNQLLGSAVELRHARAVRLLREDGAFRLELDRRPSLLARTVVLAMGNLGPAVGPLHGPSPWSSGWRSRLGPADPVLLLGTGLTMVDAVLALHAADHQGPIHAVSRHGLLPLPHRPSPPLRVTLPADFRRAGLRRKLRCLRAAARREGILGGDWRPVIDSLRADTPALWHGLSLVERRRFLRHLRAYWDAHRHRMPPAAAAVIAELRLSGQLQVRAGRVHRLHARDGAIEAHIQVRGAGDREVLRVAQVIDCTGPARWIREVNDPFIRSLLEDGLARPDDLGIGLDTDPSGAVLGAGGSPTEALYAIGPLRRGSLWESTAVPEIRVQAVELAARLLDRAPWLDVLAGRHP
ncbi:MAG TPA: FAD/NAD(P)-binding protein [Myxococcales bacterium]|nr:FAD/NAD(P)-binding protein [Myxococcales bacterium]